LQWLAQLHFNDPSLLLDVVESRNVRNGVVSQVRLCFARTIAAEAVPKFMDSARLYFGWVIVPKSAVVRRGGVTLSPDLENPLPVPDSRTKITVAPSSTNGPGAQLALPCDASVQLLLHAPFPISGVVVKWRYGCANVVTFEAHVPMSDKPAVMAAVAELRNHVQDTGETISLIGA
jgi:hypothetical protein